MKIKLFLLGLAGPLVLASCSGTKEQLGLTKKAPDEFAVVRRAPLSMPPDYTLRPPVPGQARPQEVATEETAKAMLFGEPEKVIVRDNLSESENIFLRQAGANIADPDIRTKIKAEENIKLKDNRPIGQKLFGIGGDSDEAEVLDAKEEFQRIRGKDDDESSESE